MTQQRDIERLLDHWFSDGPTRVPDRVLEVVADRIEHRSQRHGWRLNERSSRMPTYARIAATAAAVLAIAVIGYNLLPAGPSPVGGPAVAASPSMTPSAVPSPVTLHAGPLTATTYVTQPMSDLSSMSVSFAVPDGWSGFPTWAVLGPNGTGAPGGVGVGFLLASGLFSDPCHWDASGNGSWPQRGDVPIGTTATEMAAALAASDAYESSTPTDVSLAGYNGIRLDLTLPSDIDLASCDAVTGKPAGSYFVWGTDDPGGSDLFAQGPGQQWHLWILDVDGTRLVIVIDAYPGTPPEDLTAAEAIVNSVTIRP